MTNKRIALSFFLTLCLAVTALANDGWNKNSEYNRLYNPKTVVTLRGEVRSIETDVQPLPGMAPGVVAVVDTEDGSMNVHLGPKWFTKFYKQKWDLKAGDKVEITGSVLNYQGSQTMILQSGKKGDLEMVVRGRDGSPVWDPEVKGF